MTLLLPMNVTNLYTPLAIIEGEQCLEDESYFCDEWSTSADFDFLETCNNSTEDVYPVKDACQGIKRKHLEDSPAGGNSTTTNILEQQRFVHKLSFEKLRKLEDPESCLRRSVLINNTLKYLHTQIYPVETPCYEFYTGFNPSDHHRMNISPLIRKRSLTNIQTEVVQQSINSDTNSSEMQVPELSNPRGFTTEKHDKNSLSATLDDEQNSVFCELDNVFHNFICALET